VATRRKSDFEVGQAKKKKAGRTGGLGAAATVEKTNPGRGLGGGGLGGRELGGGGPQDFSWWAWGGKNNHRPFRSAK